MKKTYFPSSLLLLLLRLVPAQAQYIATPPIQDGNVSDGEYGNTYVGNQNTNKFTTTNNSVGDGGTWYMTWDATNLYVAKTGGQDSEPTILYFDIDPTLPVTGGGTDKGNLKGKSDNGVIPGLPFRADVRVSVSGASGSQIIDISRRDGQGNWTGAMPARTSYSAATTNREFSLNWNDLTGSGIPASFNWLGYATNTSSGSGNYRYDQAPANPKAFGNSGSTTPPTEYYYTVASTADGNATKPFLLKSYVFLGTASGSSMADNAFGAIDVWDFTLNLAGGQISRGTTAGNWNIGGSLVVGNGTLYFGNSSNGNDFGTTNVGNIRVMGNGILYMDQTTKPIYVREDVDLTGGGQFRLSGAQGGDLFVGRSFLVKDGLATTQATFQPMQRAVTFTGTGVTHVIQASNTGYAVPFSYLTIDSPSSTVELGSDILVGNQISFNQGRILTGTNYVQLDGASTLVNESATSHIIGNTRITQQLGTSQSGAKYFGNTGFSLNPQNSTAALGTVTLTRVTGTALAGVGTGNNGAGIERYFILTNTNAPASGLDLQLQFSFRDDEQNNIADNRLALYQSPSGAPGTFTRLTTPSASTTTSLSYNYTGALPNGTYFTLGDGAAPLPVTLVSFTASPTAQGAASLQWRTASELNNKGFGIERQLDASTSWQSVGYVAATGLLTGSTYAFVDKSLATAPTTAVAYYRLRQEDQDGTLSYSPVASVARPAVARTSELTLSPVPTSSNLSVAFAEASQAGLEVAITNTQGQRLLHLTTQASTDAALSLPVDNLAAGVYILTVQVPGQAARHARFVKL